MACPEENIQLWPAELWRKSLTSFQTGVIPIVWTTGQLPNSAGADNDPWLGRLIPRRARWVGNTVEISYDSGFYDRGACTIALPKMTVIIQGFCLWGLNNITIEVIAEKRRFFNHFVSTNNSFGYFYPRGGPREAPPCGRKYDNPNYFGIELGDLAKWLDITLDYAVEVTGTVPDWWQTAFDFKPFGRFAPCEGCMYGFLEELKGFGTDTWDDLQLGTFPVRVFPLKRNQGQVVITTCPNSVALVVDTDTGDADRYIRSPLTCGDEDTYVRSELFISDECFEKDNDEDEFPPDTDPRWRSPQVNTSCDYDTFQLFPAPGASSMPTSGNYKGAVSSSVPKQTIITSVTVMREPPEDGKPPFIFQTNTYVFGAYKYRRKFENDGNGWVDKTSTDVEVLGTMTYTLDGSSHDSHRSSNDAAAARIVAWGNSIQNWKDKRNCDAPFIMEDPDFPDPPLIRPPLQKRLNLDGKCYFKGVITIGIKYDIEFIRTFRKLGPEVQEWAIRKIVPKFIPTSIKFPFQIRIPQGEAPFFGSSLNLTGTFLQIGTGPNSIVINIEEIFAYYNLVDDVGILGLIIPGPIGVSDLSTFCED